MYNLYYFLGERLQSSNQDLALVVNAGGAAISRTEDDDEDD